VSLEGEAALGVGDAGEGEVVIVAGGDDVLAAWGGKYSSWLNASTSIWRLEGMFCSSQDYFSMLLRKFKTLYAIHTY
jgi:hypothetical protein